MVVRQVVSQSQLRSLFFFNDTATTEIYTLSLHDALPICPPLAPQRDPAGDAARVARRVRHPHAQDQPDRPQASQPRTRSEEHTSELQSRQYLVCRLLLEKKKNIN